MEAIVFLGVTVSLVIRGTVQPMPAAALGLLAALTIPTLVSFSLKAFLAMPGVVILPYLVVIATAFYLGRWGMPSRY